MIRVERQLDIRPSYPFEELAPLEQLLFFDIETTGLTASKAALYLIGAVHWKNGCWTLEQFFAENMLEEPELLEAFFDILQSKRSHGRVILISYNGDGFDVPFLKNCIRQYRLPYDFNGTLSLDLLKKVRPYKHFAGLPDCRLKTVEKAVGIEREDRFNGGELIYVYEEYLRLKALDPESCESTPLNEKLEDHLLKTLLLHNAEDIADMPMVMDMLAYEALFAGGYEISSAALEDGVWDIRARLRMPLPKGFYREMPEWTLSISEEDPYLLNLAVPVYQGELKYFFVDYKNYYYLPAEDYAIHKSVGEFVDRKARRRATAATCYQRKSGAFIPQPSPVLTPCFYRAYKTAPAYGLLPEGGTPDGDTAARYVKAVLQSLL